MIDADIDMVLRRRDAQDGLSPIGFYMEIVGIGPDRFFKSLAGDAVGLPPISPVLAAHNFGFDLFS
jgi:hypothetical protein